MSYYACTTETSERDERGKMKRKKEKKEKSQCTACEVSSRLLEFHPQFFASSAAPAACSSPPLCMHSTTVINPYPAVGVLGLHTIQPCNSKSPPGKSRTPTTHCSAPHTVHTQTHTSMQPAQRERGGGRAERTDDEPDNARDISAPPAHFQWRKPKGKQNGLPGAQLTFRPWCCPV